MAHNFSVKFLDGTSYQEGGFARAFDTVFATKPTYTASGNVFTLGNFNTLCGGYFVEANGSTDFVVNSRSYIYLRLERDLVNDILDVSLVNSPQEKTNTATVFFAKLFKIHFSETRIVVDEYYMGRNSTIAFDSIYRSITSLGLENTTNLLQIFDAMKVDQVLFVELYSNLLNLVPEFGDVGNLVCTKKSSNKMSIVHFGDNFSKDYVYDRSNNVVTQCGNAVLNTGSYTTDASLAGIELDKWDAIKVYAGGGFLPIVLYKNGTGTGFYGNGTYSSTAFGGSDAHVKIALGKPSGTWKVEYSTVLYHQRTGSHTGFNNTTFVGIRGVDYNAKSN